MIQYVDIPSNVEEEKRADQGHVLFRFHVRSRNKNYKVVPHSLPSWFYNIYKYIIIKKKHYIGFMLDIFILSGMYKPTYN